MHNVRTPYCYIFFSWRNNPPIGQGLLFIETSRSHSDAPHSVRLLWTSDQTDAETSTWQPTALTTDNPAPGEIRTRNPSNQVATIPRLRPRGYWHWPLLLLLLLKYCNNVENNTQSLRKLQFKHVRRRLPFAGNASNIWHVRF